MHAIMPPCFLIRISFCVFCLLTTSVLLAPWCMARGKYDPDPGERLGSDLPDAECGQLEVAVKRILRDRATPNKRVPDFTDTEYRWYTNCPAGRIAWEHKKTQEKKEQEERIANYGRSKSRPDSLETPGESAASSADIDKLTTYAVILGRAVACGANVDDASRRVGRWMDKIFPPGSNDQKTYLLVFTEGVRYHAQQQKEGKSPDTCSAVLRALNGFPWP